jgi:hypothetical protein|tara:strand:+ start:147 stop:431 length:285 start_codon:yes stop_codon:yes gene_type:complete
MIHPDIKPEMVETTYVELNSQTEEYETKGHDVVYCPQCFEDAYETGKTMRMQMQPAPIRYELNVDECKSINVQNKLRDLENNHIDRWLEGGEHK